MTAVLARARSELRARIPAVLALGILLGLGAGAVMMLAAGARRTDTVYPRFARAYKAADVTIISYPQGPGGQEFAQLDFTVVAKEPQVADAATVHFLATTENLQILAGDAAYGTTVDRPKLLEGRLP